MHIKVCVCAHCTWQQAVTLWAIWVTDVFLNLQDFCTGCAEGVFEVALLPLIYCDFHQSACSFTGNMIFTWHAGEVEGYRLALRLFKKNEQHCCAVMKSSGKLFDSNTCNLPVKYSRFFCVLTDYVTQRLIDSCWWLFKGVLVNNSAGSIPFLQTATGWLPVSQVSLDLITAKLRGLVTSNEKKFTPSQCADREMSHSDHSSCFMSNMWYLHYSVDSQ